MGLGRDGASAPRPRRRLEALTISFSLAETNATTHVERAEHARSTRRVAGTAGDASGARVEAHSQEEATEAGSSSCLPAKWMHKNSAMPFQVALFSPPASAKNPWGSYCKYRRSRYICWVFAMSDRVCLASPLRVFKLHPTHGGRIPSLCADPVVHHV